MDSSNLVLKLGQTLSIAAPEVIVMMIFGLILVLFGYRIKKIAFFIIWFLIGYNVVQYLMPALTSFIPQIKGSQLWSVLIPVAGGILTTFLGFLIEKLCVGGICFALVVLIAIRYFGVDMSVLVVSSILGIIAGGAAVTLMKPATIIATSFAGSYAATLAFLSIATNFPPQNYYWPILLVVAILGSGFQFVTTKRLS